MGTLAPPVVGEVVLVLLVPLALTSSVSGNHLVDHELVSHSVSLNHVLAHDVVISNLLVMSSPVCSLCISSCTECIACDSLANWS